MAQATKFVWANEAGDGGYQRLEIIPYSNLDSEKIRVSGC